MTTPSASDTASIDTRAFIKPPKSDFRPVMPACAGTLPVRSSRPRVISRARPYGRSRHVDFHSDGAKFAILGKVRRRITDHILIADLVRDFRHHGRNGVHICEKPRSPSG